MASRRSSGPAVAVEVMASVVPADRLDGIDCLDASIRPAIADAWLAAGLRLTEMRPATACRGRGERLHLGAAPRRRATGVAADGCPLG